MLAKRHEPVPLTGFGTRSNWLRYQINFDKSSWVCKPNNWFASVSKSLRDSKEGGTLPSTNLTSLRASVRTSWPADFLFWVANTSDGPFGGSLCRTNTSLYAGTPLNWSRASWTCASVKISRGTGAGSTILKLNKMTTVMAP